MRKSIGGLRMNDKFPKIKKSICDFFEDDDGSITRNKVLMIGGMVLVLGVLLGEEIYAAHRTHYTHRTHSSHRTSNSKHGSHSTHYTSHSTHSNHYTHGSHSSHASHVSYTESSNYGSTNTSTGRAWPELSDIQSVDIPTATTMPALAESLEMLPIIDSIKNPSVSGAEATMLDTKPNIQEPPQTPQFKNVTEK